MKNKIYILIAVIIIFFTTKIFAQTELPSNTRPATPLHSLCAVGCSFHPTVFPARCQMKRTSDTT